MANDQRSTDERDTDGEWRSPGSGGRYVDDFAVADRRSRPRVRGSAAAIDDENVWFMGYDPDAPERGRRAGGRNSTGNILQSEGQ